MINQENLLFSIELLKQMSIIHIFFTFFWGKNLNPWYQSPSKKKFFAISITIYQILILVNNKINVNYKFYSNHFLNTLTKWNIFLATCRNIPGKVGLNMSCKLLGQLLYLLSFSKSFIYCKKKIKIINKLIPIATSSH